MRNRPQHPAHTDHAFSSSNGSRCERVCLIDAKESSCSIQVTATHTVAVAYWLAWSGGLVVNGLKDGEIFKRRPRNWARFRGHHGEKC